MKILDRKLLGYRFVPRTPRPLQSAAGLRRCSSPSIMHSDGSSVEPTYDRDPAELVAEEELAPRRQLHADELVELALRLAQSPSVRMPSEICEGIVHDLLSSTGETRLSAEAIAERWGVATSTVYRIRGAVRQHLDFT